LVTVTNWNGGFELLVGTIVIVEVEETGLHAKPNKMKIIPGKRIRHLLISVTNPELYQNQKHRYSCRRLDSTPGGI
jgi:hypothetical protein